MQYVTKVAVKLPDFWTKDPDLWFLHAEAAFRNVQITQFRTKFDHVVQKPPQNIMVFYNILYSSFIFVYSKITLNNIKVYKLLLFSLDIAF